MISVNKARKILSDNLDRSQIRTLPIGKCLGLVLAEDIHSPIDVPSFDNSAKDGYAIKFEEHNSFYSLKNSIQAGDTSDYKINRGEAARIFTGAKIPEGADTVIPQELVQKDENAGTINFPNENLGSGKDVRYTGSQCRKGDLIAEKGTKIRTGTIGLFASVGLAHVKIYAPPKVSFIITGNELREPGTPIRPGEIYNANGPMLEVLLKNSGIIETSELRASDDRHELQEVINGALMDTDVLLISGGISVGDYDFVEECLGVAGVQELFYKVKQRPGKPFFAGKKDRKWIFALPGNPASVFSCYNQYVAPCLRYLMGDNQVWKPDAILPLKEDQKKKAGFTFFLKAKKEGESLEILRGQQSFDLKAFSQANCLVELEEKSELVKAGTPVKIYQL